MHSVNDLSRWQTVYSLAERGTYNIDETPWPDTIIGSACAATFIPPSLPCLKPCWPASTCC